MNLSSTRRRLFASALAGLLCHSLPVFAQSPDNSRILTRETTGYTLTLRLPQNAIVAGAETVLYLRVEEGDDKKAVPYSRVEATAKPAAGGKTAAFAALPGGVAGEYTLVGNFPVEGTYEIAVKVTPPGDGAKSVEATFATVTVVAEKGKQTESNVYQLKVETTPAQPLPGEVVSLRLSIVDATTKKRVTDFEAIYGARMHLYMVREDVGTLRRDKPVYLQVAPGSKDDGVFTLDTAFSSGGEWRLFAEVAPTKQGTQIVSARVTIPGAQSLSEPMMAQIAPVIRQSNVTLRFARPTRFVARQTVYLPLLLEDSQGNALSDLQMTDTALAHLFFVDKSGKQFVHTVPDTGDLGSINNNKQMSFPVRFPAGGTYRAFFIASRAAQPVLVSFVVRVSDK
ncbi:MAG: hypothetical protein H7Y38_16940 [Armatimonadetes bacterium]|nr:hypothetical protein [Armatimonadota bacterium]